MAKALHVIVLGSAAGGGFPQWNCRCPVCSLAWDGDPRVSPRTQSSLAVSADGGAWVLLNASPDLRQQILLTPQLRPQTGARHSPIGAVILTNGDVDHIAGLLTMREKQPFRLLASAALLQMIDTDPIFAVLDPAAVERQPMAADTPITVLSGLTVEGFAVPGKVPLFLERGEVAVGAEGEMTIGLDISSGGRRLVYVPGCATITDRLLRRVEGADILMFDGTTFTDDEMVRLGLSPKTAGRMGHVAIDGTAGSLQGLAGVAVGRRIYIHINNTNPILVDGSPERQIVENAGWEVAFDGMEIAV